MFQLIMIVLLAQFSINVNGAQAAQPSILVQATLSENYNEQNQLIKHCCVVATLKTATHDLSFTKKISLNSVSGNETAEESLSAAEKTQAEEHTELVLCMEMAKQDAFKHGTPATYYYQNHPKEGFKLLGSQGLAAGSPVNKHHN